MHRERPFFNALVEFMISGPVMIQALEGDNAIAKKSRLMGATDPKAGRGGHDTRGLRRHRSMPMPCMVRMRRKQRKSKSRIFFATSEVSGRAEVMDVTELTSINLLDLDRQGLRDLFVATRREALPRRAGHEMDVPPPRHRFRRR